LQLGSLIAGPEGGFVLVIRGWRIAVTIREAEAVQCSDAIAEGLHNLQVLLATNATGGLENDGLALARRLVDSGLSLR